jgi:hypothetical protein
VLGVWHVGFGKKVIDAQNSTPRRLPPQVLQRGVRGHRQRASSCVIVASADFTTGVGERQRGHRATVHRGGTKSPSKVRGRSKPKVILCSFPDCSQVPLPPPQQWVWWVRAMGPRGASGGSESVTRTTLSSTTSLPSKHHTPPQQLVRGPLCMRCDCMQSMISLC